MLALVDLILCMHASMIMIILLFHDYILIDSKYVCQVFYHKSEEINHWIVTLVFFTMNQTKVSILVHIIVLYMHAHFTCNCTVHYL